MQHCLLSQHCKMSTILTGRACATAVQSDGFGGASPSLAALTSPSSHPNVPLPARACACRLSGQLWRAGSVRCIQLHHHGTEQQQ